MSVHIYQYGESGNLPGVSIGVTRQAPRGVRREERAARGYFDLWLPMLGPSRELLDTYKKGKIPFGTFARRYRAEMKRAEPRQVIALLAGMAKSRRLNLGCFCGDPECCHRSILRDLVVAEMQQADAEGDAPAVEETRGYASPPCYAADFPDED